MINNNFQSRVSIPIDTFQFLSIFFLQDTRVFFRLIHEIDKYSKNEDCILSNNEYQLPLFEKVFRAKQQEGYGVFFVVQAGGQRKETIKKLTCHCVDYDFGKINTGNRDEDGKIIFKHRTPEELEKYKVKGLEQLYRFELEPSVIVETKNGYHAYWLLDKSKEQNITLFRDIQISLCNSFGEKGDKRSTDIAHVLRIPGYYHLKDLNKPFMIKCIKFSPDIKYSQKDIADAIKINLYDIGVCVVRTSKDTDKGAQKDNLKKTDNEKPIGGKNKQMSLQNQGCSGQETININSYSNLFSYLKRQDIAEYLEIESEVNKHFCCLFHSDNSPSAIIKIQNDQYRYFCFGEHCICNNEHGLDIIDLTKIIKGCNTTVALKLLCQNYKINFVDEEWVHEQKSKYEFNLLYLSDKRISKNNPNLYKIIFKKTNPRILMRIIDYANQHITNRFFSCGANDIFFVSGYYLSSITNIPQSKINKYINLYAALGLINKINIKDIPSYIREDAIKYALIKKHKPIGFYTISNFDDIIDEAEQRSKKFLEATNGSLTIKSISKKYLENIFGNDFATKIYSDRSFNTKSGDDIREIIENHIFIHIAKYGYSNFNMLVMENPKIGTKRIGKDKLYEEYKKMIPQLIRQYNLYFYKVNRNIKHQLLIPSKGYGYIITNIPKS